MLKSIYYDWVPPKATFIVRHYHCCTSTKCAFCRLLGLLIEALNISNPTASTTMTAKAASHFYLKYFFVYSVTVSL